MESKNCELSIFFLYGAAFTKPTHQHRCLLMRRRSRWYHRTLTTSSHPQTRLQNPVNGARQNVCGKTFWLTQPDHAQALCSLALHALQRGDVNAGITQLEAAHQSAPTDLFVLMTLINVYREEGDATCERDAIATALAVDPYFVPALLAKGNWLEQFGSTAAAAAAYRNALKISPSEQLWPSAHRAQLKHAAAVVAQHTEAFADYLSAGVSELITALPAVSINRWLEALAIRAGASTPYISESNQLHVPRLPAVPFFERSHFPFLSKLEQKSEMICHEILDVFERDRSSLTPYIHYQPGQPVNQWQELDHSERWSAFHLWRGGSPVTENLTRCPETAKALAALPMADLDGLSPNAMFSALAPHTRIPPHNGESNARVIVHLPLIVPPGCCFRVGFEEREWSVGECLIFDDTIEHEARNDSDEWRIVLILDLWNPLLTDVERRLVNRIATASREYDALPSPAP